MNFKINHPEWQPDQHGSQFIKNVNTGKRSLFSAAESQFVKRGVNKSPDTKESILDSFIRGESDYRPENVAREFVAMLV